MYSIDLNQDVGKKFEKFNYPAGEKQIRLLDSELEAVAKTKDIRITARITNGEIMDLALLRDAIQGVNAGNGHVHLILPYLPYSRADRRFKLGDCNGLKAFGNVLSDLHFSTVVTLDVHSSAAHSHIPNLLNVSPQLFIDHITYMVEINADPTILLPDKGASRYKLKYKNILHCDKKRNPVTGNLEGFTVPLIHNFKRDSVLIIDDICDGGGTFLGIAKELPPHLNLQLYVSHGIFSKGTEQLEKAFKNVFTTDSTWFPKGNAHVFKCEPLLNKALDEYLEKK